MSSVVIIDGPYGMHKYPGDVIRTHGTQQLYRHVLRQSLAVSHVIVFGTFESLAWIHEHCRPSALTLRTAVIWHKPDSTAGGVSTWAPRHELFLHYAQADAWFDADAIRVPYGARAQAGVRMKHGQTVNWQPHPLGARCGNVVSYVSDRLLTKQHGRTRSNKHPCVKPKPLLDMVVRATTQPGDTVYEPFVGSSNLAEVCATLQRQYVGYNNATEFHLTDALSEDCMPPTHFKTVDWESYERLAETAPTSLTWASRGGDGSGKSHFACTAPGPIFVCGFDPYGMQRVNKDVRQGKEIRIGRYGFNCAEHGESRSVVSAAAEAIWNRFVGDYRSILKYMSQNGKPHQQRGTVLWDREDLAWELLRYATFGGQKNEGSKTGALDYGDLNAEYVSLIQEARAAGVNLGLLQGLTDNWIAKFDPQKAKMVNYQIGQKPDGFRKLADHVDITLDHRWDPEQKEYVVKFVKFPNKDAKDSEYPNVTFTDMATFAFPDTAESDWS